PAAAQDAIAFVKDDRLARSDGALRLLEVYAGAAVRAGHDSRGGSSVAVADLGVANERLGGWIDKPVDARGTQGWGEQLVPFPNNHGVRFWNDVQHIASARGAKAQSLAL